MPIHKNVHPMKVLGLGRVKIEGSFLPIAGPSVSKNKGQGFTVARTNVGVYTLTFSDVLISLENFQCSLREAGGTAGTIVQGGDYVAASKTLQIRVFQEAAGTLALVDLAADVDNEIYFSVTARNTSVNY